LSLFDYLLIEHTFKLWILRFVSMGLLRSPKKILNQLRESLGVQDQALASPSVDFTEPLMALKFDSYPHLE